MLYKEVCRLLCVKQLLHAWTTGIKQLLLILFHKQVSAIWHTYFEMLAQLFDKESQAEEQTTSCNPDNAHYAEQMQFSQQLRKPTDLSASPNRLCNVGSFTIFQASNMSSGH